LIDSSIGKSNLAFLRALNPYWQSDTNSQLLSGARDYVYSKNLSSRNLIHEEKAVSVPDSFSVWTFKNPSIMKRNIFPNGSVKEVLN